MGYPRPTATEVQKQVEQSLWTMGVPAGNYSFTYNQEKMRLTVEGTHPGTSVPFSFEVYVQEGSAAAHEAVKEGLYRG